MELVIISGLSGAGKSRSIAFFEDMKYYCVDNMPIQLLPNFVNLCLNSIDGLDKVALGVDVRTNTDDFKDLYNQLDTFTAENENFTYKTLFIDATDECIIKRYKETRRSHPLINAENSGSLTQIITQERQMLEYIKSRADYLVDTTNILPPQLKEVLENIFISQNKKIIIQILSFGFKHGLPLESDFVFDVRCLPNPFYVPELKEKTGLEKDVSDYVFDSEMTVFMYNRFLELILYGLPFYSLEGKKNMVIAIGCTGGHHRSVALSEQLRKDIIEAGYTVSVTHRDIKK